MKKGEIAGLGIGAFQASAPRPTTLTNGSSGNPKADRKFIDRVAEVAKARGIPRAPVSLAWLLSKLVISAPIVGGTKLHHLDDALASVNVKLSDDEITSLEEPSCRMRLSASSKPAFGGQFVPLASRLVRPTSIFAALLLGAVIALRGFPSGAESARLIPPPMLDEPADPQATSEIAILAGGCFWGVQGIFQHVEGVTSAVSGYAGGAADTAHYEMVSSSTTGHAEAVRVTFDPRRISYGRILQIYFSVAHDPTELNRQGPDVGSQYRAAIFPTNPEQARIADAYIAQLNQLHVFDAPIVTKVEPGRAFYPAEDYHQDFLTRNPRYPYIVINDLPKIENLKRLFPEFYRAAPVLVANATPRS